MKSCGCSALWYCRRKGGDLQVNLKYKISIKFKWPFERSPVSDHMYRMKTPIPFKEYLVLEDCIESLPGSNL
jgi:hypothetical protein